MNTLHLHKDNFFLRVATDPKEGALYDHGEGKGYWVGYLLPEKGEENQPNIMSLSDSWQRHVINNSYGGSYLFCSSEPIDKVEFLRKIIKKLKIWNSVGKKVLIDFFSGVI